MAFAGFLQRHSSMSSSISSIGSYSSPSSSSSALILLLERLLVLEEAGVSFAGDVPISLLAARAAGCGTACGGGNKRRAGKKEGGKKKKKKRAVTLK